ncbi:hypothetical protein P691DRAFT_760723 [Macrolepiota fuliginosa MF-IS2]|uniref:F-box domain-containing protein n=1 Tax=Macrolepiota fuliginosa MF-IS2 TaxID=1400762 RepID=A0A9P5XA49_9AGAR|nr:hypothetical protein P691DRAFT_760723 [Macrolepiota fuliginosa MF-IS2]
MAGYMPWPLDIRIQWKQLTTLNLGSSSFYIDEVTKVLTMCPNLEVCSVSLSTSGNQSPLITPPPPLPSLQIAELCLPKLRTLSIFNCSSWNDHVIVLFENLSTPALRHLSYRRTVRVWPDSPVTRDADNAFMAALCAFLRRLVLPLEELEFYTRPFIGNNVLKILPLVPGLKRLSLRGYSMDSRYHLDSPSLIIRMDDEFLEYFIPDTNKHASGRISPLALSDISDGENDEDDHDGSPPR